MPPVPKRKRSQARRGAHHSQWKSALGGRLRLVPCPRCKEPRPAHRVCPNCGTYRGREVLELEAAKKRE
ncbi:MAG: 50S ribosomal protein L32 [Chloroflexi bacterium]|nr:50S ribosomal protein L32 [Chloroflexota bacterium]